MAPHPPLTVPVAPHITTAVHPPCAVGHVCAVYLSHATHTAPHHPPDTPPPTQPTTPLAVNHHHHHQHATYHSLVLLTITPTLYTLNHHSAG